MAKNIAKYHSAVMQQFSSTIFMLLLNRLQSKPSTQFTASFVYLFGFMCALDGVGPDFVVSTLDAIQAGWVRITGASLTIIACMGTC